MNTKSILSCLKANPLGFSAALLIAMVACSGCSGTAEPEPDPISLPHRGSPESDAGHGCINCPQETPQDLPHLQSEGSKSLDDATKTTLGPKG